MIAKRVMLHVVVVCDGCGADAREERDTARNYWPDDDSGWWTDGAACDLCPTCWAKSDEALTRKMTT